MAIEITVPRLGWSMDEGTFAEWLKQEGEFVRKGDMLFVLEGDKASQEIESFDEGILRLPPNAPKAGDTVKVGQVLAFLVAEGEPAPFEGLTAGGAAKSQASVATGARTNEPGPGAVISSNGGRVAQPAASVGTSRRAARSSPRARRRAAELHVDWTSLVGSGRSGRVRERDVLAASHAGHGEREAGGAVPHSAIRRKIAERMLASHLITAPVTLTTTLDAVNLVNLRDQFKTAVTAGDIVPSYTDFIAKLSSVALSRHPSVNSRWENDHIVIAGGIHIGIAVDTDTGLLVPVIRNVTQLTLRQVASKSRELIERARSRRLAAEELSGGTFTITNLGSFGIDAFTPIINVPECAVLGVGRIQRRPVVQNERIVAREQLTLSLTFDHRIIDGAPAARFLQYLSSLIENPGPRLMS